MTEHNQANSKTSVKSSRPPNGTFNKVQLVVVDEASEGQRVDNFLLRKLKGVPKSKIYRIIRKGEVRVNKKRCKPDTKLSLSDSVRIPPITTQSSATPAKPSDSLQKLLLASILYESDDYLVLNKPAGLPVHGGSGIHLGMVEALRQMQQQWCSLELAHRLDRDTSGCIVLAKNSKFLKHIHHELKERRVEKIYHALVHGSWSATATKINAPLSKNELLSGERVVRVDANGKASSTLFSILERFSNATLIEARPITGRTHQIRVHCFYAGHPIVGDAKYTPSSKVKVFPAAKQLCLHARSLRFTLANGESSPLFTAPLNSKFTGIMTELGEKPGN